MPRGGGELVDDIVRRAPLFTALDDEAAASLRNTMTQGRLGRSEVLFAEGDRGDRLYVIVDGKIKLGRTSGDGRENLLAILGPGERFGGPGLFSPGPRTSPCAAPAPGGPPPGRSARAGGAASATRISSRSCAVTRWLHRPCCTR